MVKYGSLYVGGVFLFMLTQFGVNNKPHRGVRSQTLGQVTQTAHEIGESWAQPNAFWFSLNKLTTLE